VKSKAGWKVEPAGGGAAAGGKERWGGLVDTEGLKMAQLNSSSAAQAGDEKTSALWGGIPGRAGQCYFFIRLIWRVAV